MSIVTTQYANVDTSREAFYDASMFAENDWRIYEIDGESERWVLRVTGQDAEQKAEAIAAILRGEEGK